MAEGKAINNAMGGHKPAVYAPKGALGHSVGAVGAVESILTVLALRDGVIPPTLNLKNLDPEIDLDVVARRAATRQLSIRDQQLVRIRWAQRRARLREVLKRADIRRLQEVSMTIMAPEAVGESLDPRDPLLRLSTFFDDGSVELLHERDRSGVLAAAGTVNGVRTIAFCTDGTVMGGAMGVEGCAHIVNAYDTAIEEQSPIVGIWHSGGARLAEGVKALHAVGLVFEAMIRASGYVPQISVVVGFAAGGAAYGPALTDVVIMAPEGRVFVTGPDVVRSVTGEDVDMASLGGPDTHHKKSGVCHIVADDELDAYERGRRLVGLFCQQGHFDRTKAEAGDTDLHALLPDSARRAYDVHPLVEALLDDDAPFEEFQAKWAPSMVDRPRPAVRAAPSACSPTTRCASAAA